MTTAVKNSQDVYLHHYRDFEKRVAGKDPTWLRALRADAIQAFADLGFPTTHLEDWKYTNVAPIASTTFQPGSGELGSADEETLRQSPFF